MSDKKPITTEEKIAFLYKYHSHSHPEAREQLRTWDERLSRLNIDKKWLAHPNTRELRVLIMEKINNIVSVLANNENLNEAERKAFFKDKKSMVGRLAVLTDDPEKEIENIKSAVDHEAEGL